MARRRTNLKLLSRVCKCIVALCLLVALFLAGLWLWLSGDKRDISSLNPYIESALQAGQSELSIAIGSTFLRWDHLLSPAVVEVDDVRLLNQSKEIVQRVPSLSLSLHPLHAMMGRVVPHHITLTKPEMTLVERKNGEWFWVGENGKGIALMPLVGALVAGKTHQNTELPFNSLAIADAKITLYREASDVTYVFEQVDAMLQRGHDGQSDLSYRTVLRVAEDVLPLSGKGSFNASSQNGQLSLALVEANPLRLCGMVMECDDLPSLDLPLTGKITVQFVEGTQIDSVAFALQGAFGSLAFQPHLPETITIESLAVKGQLSNGLQALHIHSLAVDLGQTELAATLKAERVEDAYRLFVQGSAHNMPVNDLARYWPTTRAPESRAWVTSAIRGGMATEASLTLHLEPDEFNAPVLPDHAIKASVKVKDATVEYIKGYPKARNINATVDFTGATITSTSRNGAMLNGTRIAKSIIHFPDLNHPNVPVEMDLTLESNAADVLAFLTPQRFDFAPDVPLDTSQAKGRVKGHLKLGFDTFSEASASDSVNWDKVRYDVTSSLHDVGGVRYDNRYAIEGASGTFEADNKHLVAAVSAQVNGSPLQLGYTEGEGKHPVYRIKGDLSHAMLVQEGLSKELPLKGTIGVDATIEKTPRGNAITATLDLAQAALALPELDYQKAAGTDASLQLKPAADADATAFSYQSDALKVAGTAWIDAKKQSLTGVDLPRFVHQGQDFSLRYRKQDTGDLIDLKGARADVSAWTEGDDSESQSISSMPPVQLKLDVGTLVLGEHRVLREAKGHLTCTPARCESADLSARFEDKGNMSLRIFHERGQRKFSLHSDDAGNLLRAFDVVDKMYGGAFDLKGTYDDAKAGNPLSGRLIINDFKLKDAPILGRILNLSSLTGLVESLSGQGIGFDKLASDLHFVNDVATLKGGKASGSSLGISMDGTINLANSNIAVEGSFAPAHMLNSIVSKIPILGVALAGGEGESIFAFNYGVKGTYADPQVSVNPLSVLTPGFTRKFFDIFDQPPPKELEQPAKPAIKPEAAPPKP